MSSWASLSEEEKAELSRKYEEERKRERQIEAARVAKGKEVLKALGFSLVGENEENNRAVGTLPDGRKVYISINWRNKDRFDVSGHYPTHEDRGYQEKRPKITVSNERPVEKIVADIQRRFLPEYSQVFEKSKAHLERSQNSEAKRKAAFKEACEVLGLESDRHYNSDCKAYGQNGLKLQVHYDGDIDLDLGRITKEQLAEIAKVLRK
jgi:hypothetical protein